MARRRDAAGLTNLERFGGTVFFVFYLLLLPVAAGPAFRLAGELLGKRIGGDLQTAVYYYGLFAVTVAVFHRLLLKTTRRFLEDPALALKSAAIGLVGLCGLNELAYRLAGAAFRTQVNLNDTAVSAQWDSAPHMTLLILLFLAPFVEEFLFRGLVFGGLKERNRALGYAVSCLLFALLHVWQYALVNRDAAYLLRMVQYMAPGLMLAWAYDHSGTLWASIGLHSLANALSALRYFA